MVQKKKKSGMYPDTKSWNPFVGCLHDCNYCKYTFKRQMKRQKQRCYTCWEYKPHEHPERLKPGKISGRHGIIFVCGNGGAT